VNSAIADFAVAAKVRFDGPHRSIQDHRWTAALGRNRTYIITAKRMISGLVLKWQKGLRFVIPRR
jgi:hypothetical protein